MCILREITWKYCSCKIEKVSIRSEKNGNCVLFHRKKWRFPNEPENWQVQIPFKNGIKMQEPSRVFHTENEVFFIEKYEDRSKSHECMYKIVQIACSISFEANHSNWALVVGNVWHFQLMQAMYYKIIEIHFH